MDNYRGAGVGVVIDCEGGYVVNPSYTRAIAYDKEGNEIKRWDGGGNHFENFINAVRSRKHTDLTAEAEEGHISAALCHTANVSYQLGKQLPPEAIRDAVKNNSELGEALGRMEEHLAANHGDLKQTPATLGALLNIDPQTERATFNRAANRLFTRDYRKPFIVPARV